MVDSNDKELVNKNHRKSKKEIEQAAAELVEQAKLNTINFKPIPFKYPPIYDKLVKALKRIKK